MDPSALSITDADLEDLGIPRADGMRGRGIAFFALLSDQEAAWRCLKRTVEGFLYVPTLRLVIGGINGCIRTTSDCPRMNRNTANGKGWALCGGYHTEIVLLLTLLVFLEKITREEYYSLLSQFRRFVFGPDEGKPDRETIEKFLCLFPRDAHKLLAGSKLILPEMGQGRGFVCLACGAILDRLGIQLPDHLRVVRLGEAEPSTSHLRAS